jgi:hypothetical protein
MADEPLPQEGEVRIEQGLARNADGSVNHDQIVFITYRYERRPERHRLWGLYVHSQDNASVLDVLIQTPPAPGGDNEYFRMPREAFGIDAEGFYLDPDSGERIKLFSEEMTWVPQGEDRDEESARARADKL